MPSQNASATEVSELEAKQEKKVASRSRNHITSEALEEAIMIDLLDDQKEMDQDDNMILASQDTL